MAAVTLIEGVGDEVTMFFLLALLTGLAVLAWWTTRVADRPMLIQAIIVGQRVFHVDEHGEPTGAEAEPEPVAAESDRSCDEEDVGQHAVGGSVQLVRADSAPTEEDATAEWGTEAGRTGQSQSAPDQPSEPEPDGEPVRPIQPDRVPNRSALSDAADQPIEQQQLRQRRLAHLDRCAAGAADRSATSSHPATHSDGPAAATSPATAWAEATPSSAGTESTVSFAPAVDPTSDPTSDSTHEPNNTTDPNTDSEPSAPSNSGFIMVKLKFLNDTQRLVEGSRQEALADFKRRHFPAETAANRLVRLIFNGRLLPDRATLDQCGLYHHCVVHCHVSAEPQLRDATAAAPGQPDQLDLGVLLYPVLTSLVTLVWGLRLRYPELFSTMAVVLLAVLTLLLVVFTAATFLPLQRIAGAAEQRRQRLGR